MTFDHLAVFNSANMCGGGSCSSSGDESGGSDFKNFPFGGLLDRKCPERRAVGHETADGGWRGAGDPGGGGGGECSRSQPSMHFPNAPVPPADVTLGDKMAADPELRRAARRHLGKWAKIMCQIVGLERVAEELMGRREWSTYQDIMVGQDSKSGEPICPAPLRPSHPISQAVREDSRSPAMAGGWYVRPASPDPQPLDLSSKPPKPPSPSKTIFKAKPRLPAVGGRRSYTEDELQAALRDIQSGKLGTRRAAVIYGIPRSTLRNKVYKISQESRDYPCLEGERGDEEEEDEERELSGAEEEREAERLLNRPFSYDELVRLTTGTSWPCLQQLLGAPGGASTSSGEEPLRRAALAFAAASAAPGSRNGDTVSPPVPPIIINKDQPLDFRRDVRPPPHHNNNNISASNKNNNHLDDKKTTSANAANMTTGGSNAGGKAQQGGKGTRPKRGKYRNYDRDSLVEAVRAVQRGEMSVHRAGSYYGVPHSTLEYKVKERHLMRPRKREPKTQQQQQGQQQGQSVPSGVTPTAPAPVEDKRKEEEKRTPQVRTPTLTPPLPANGLKIPPFLDPTIPQIYRPPFPYWQPPFPLPFGRPDLFAAQELVARRLAAQQPPTSEAESIALSKNAREIAESLLEGTENGSFLDGIIRSSLDTGLPSRESGGGKVLLEQLCRGVMPERRTPLLQTTSEPTSPGSCSGSGSQRATSPSPGPPPAKRATPSPPRASPPAPPSTSASPPAASPPPPSSPADTRPAVPLSPSSPAPPSSPHQSC